MHILKEPNRGWIEVICGSMFSGKSEDLIRRLRRAQIARQNVIAFKPRIDNRYGEDFIASHSQQQIPCVQIDTAQDIFAHIKPDTEVIGIDEVQFLGDEVVAICEELASRGVRVICAGLDQDYRGRPWHPMPELLAIAEYIHKELAICMVCGAPANRTQRNVQSGELVLIGAADSYEARCRFCHTVPEEGVQTQMFGEGEPEAE
jgi:thymidine kinase